MIKHYLTDEVGTILAIYDDSKEGVDLAYKQGETLAKAFPDSMIYLHTGEFGNSNPPQVGQTSSMRGNHSLIKTTLSTEQKSMATGVAGTAPTGHTRECECH